MGCARWNLVAVGRRLVAAGRDRVGGFSPAVGRHRARAGPAWTWLWTGASTGMEGAPLTDVVHVPLTFEVVGVLGAPDPVAPILPGLTTGGLVTIVLACAVAQVRAEWLAAMATGFLVF